MTKLLDLMIAPCGAIILAQLYLLTGGDNFERALCFSLGIFGLLFLFYGLIKGQKANRISGAFCLGLSCYLFFYFLP